MCAPFAPIFGLVNCYHFRFSISPCIVSDLIDNSTPIVYTLSVMVQTPEYAMKTFQNIGMIMLITEMCTTTIVEITASSGVGSSRETVDQTINGTRRDDDDGDDNHVPDNGKIAEAATTSTVPASNRQASPKSLSKLTNSAPLEKCTVTTDDSLRYDQIGHWPMYDHTKNCRSRCKNAKCNKFSNWYCGKCHKHLCIKTKSNCFTEYHNK